MEFAVVGGDGSNGFSTRDSRREGGGLLQKNLLLLDGRREGTIAIRTAPPQPVSQRTYSGDVNVLGFQR